MSVIRNLPLTTIRKSCFSISGAEPASRIIEAVHLRQPLLFPDSGTGSANIIKPEKALSGIFKSDDFSFLEVLPFNPGLQILESDTFSAGSDSLQTTVVHHIDNSGAGYFILL